MGAAMDVVLLLLLLFVLVMLLVEIGFKDVDVAGVEEVACCESKVWVAPFLFC